MTKEQRVKRNAFVISVPYHFTTISLRQTLWVWTIFQFIYQFGLRLPRGLDKRDFGLRNLFSLCLTSQRDQRNTRQFYLRHSLIRFLCFIVQLIRAYNEHTDALFIAEMWNVTPIKFRSHHPDIISIVSRESILIKISKAYRFLNINPCLIDRHGLNDWFEQTDRLESKAFLVN